MGLHDEPDCGAAIIGAGLGGICAAVTPIEIGIRDFVVIDRDENFGGTWLRNTYPGVGRTSRSSPTDLPSPRRGTGSDSLPPVPKYSSTHWI